MTLEFVMSFLYAIQHVQSPPISLSLSSLRMVVLLVILTLTLWVAVGGNLALLIVSLDPHIPPHFWNPICFLAHY